MATYAVVNRNEFQILRGLYTIPERLVCVFFVFWIAVSLPLWAKATAQYSLQHLQGDWVDNAFSDVLSQRYDCPVNVSDVSFKSWSEIHFRSIEIRSREGRDLIYGSRGSFKLKNMELKKLTLFETEIVLKDVFFTKEYYKSSPALKKWGYLMHKPIPVKELKLRVIQNRESTRLSIVDCRSDVLHLEGGYIIDKSGKVKDHVKVSYDAWALLKTAF